MTKSYYGKWGSGTTRFVKNLPHIYDLRPWIGALPHSLVKWPIFEKSQIGTILVTNRDSNHKCCALHLPKCPSGHFRGHISVTIQCNDMNITACYRKDRCYKMHQIWPSMSKVKVISSPNMLNSKIVISRSILGLEWNLKNCKVAQVTVYLMLISVYRCSFRYKNSSDHEKWLPFSFSVK